MTSNHSKARPGLLKKMNRNLIIQLIFKHKTISRAALAKETALALPSVMRLVDGLIKDGIVIDIGKGASSGGRRPNLLSLNKELCYIFGVEIAVKTTVVLTDMTGNIIETRHTKEMEDNTPENVLQWILDAMAKMKASYHIKDEKIAGVGLGTPGTNFKYIRGIEKTILPGWETIDVKAWFEKQVSFPVYVDNVARTRTLAEMWFGHGQHHQDFIYVLVDQGVGCGIVKENKIHEGSHNSAGEFGHHVIQYKGNPCYCGKSGCIEMYVSVGAILRHLNKEHFKDVLSDKEPLTINYLNEVGEQLAIGISNLINIFNPKAVILGGIVPMKSDTIFNALKENLHNQIFSNDALETIILRGAIETDGIGSIALVMNQLFKEQ